jgi:two-component system cell cycle sensor histidine kinase/response regulator CckA
MIMRTIIRRTLEARGCRVLQASDGDEARALLEGPEGAALDLIITDVDMPGCGGVEVAQAARALRPNLPVIFTSGQPQPTLHDEFGKAAPICFLEKPFSAGALVSCVGGILGF